MPSSAQLNSMQRSFMDERNFLIQGTNGRIYRVLENNHLAFLCAPEPGESEMSAFYRCVDQQKASRPGPPSARRRPAKPPKASS